MEYILAHETRCVSTSQATQDIFRLSHASLLTLSPETRSTTIQDAQELHTVVLDVIFIVFEVQRQVFGNETSQARSSAFQILIYALVSE
jgi:hypothetical protein